MLPSFSNSSFILRPFLLQCVFVTLLSPPSITYAYVVHRGNETDKQALIAIKAQITDDPLGITRSWNDSVHFCNWIGVTCGHLHQRVTNLKLSSLELVGSLSPYVGNLSFLTGLNLELNHFHGQIPPQIGGLFRLRHLNLTNNSFSGEIPPNLSQCSNLVLIRLGWNSLTGRIPPQIGLLPKLERVHLHFNNLTGPIPQTFGNLSSVKTLSLATNNLQGTIPEALGQLNTLNFLGLGVNQLSGVISPAIFNLSSLVIFSMPFNQLHGTLPSDLAFTLTNLQVLNIGHNLLSGLLPKSLSNASNLVEFDITGSNFKGKVSIDFGGLSNLWWLSLASNPLGTGEGDDLRFMKSLSKCGTLKVLDLSDCQFGGELPDSIANLSTNVLSIRLNANHLSGSIPPGIQNLVNLTELQLQENKLTGSIPTVIGNLSMLRLLDLSENHLSGNIPASISNITQLYALHLQKNYLTGIIPLSFGNFQYLQELDLSQNLVNGTIPSRLMSLRSLTISLNLAHNKLSGSLPFEVGKLKNLGHLDVSENMLSGEIPSSIGGSLTLVHLQMAGNFFEGPIPPSFSSLRGLQLLDLSRNNLSGKIPGFLQRISFTHLNLSFNQFDGQVPTEGVFRNASAVSLAGNLRLCGGIPELQLPACPQIGDLREKSLSPGLKLMIPLLSGLVGLVIVMSLLIIWRNKRRTKGESRPPSSPTESLFSKVTYGDLFKATDGFSPSNLIGTGSFGSVYRGRLDPDETIVAVKVFDLQMRGAFKSFMAECGALRNIRHRNLVKIYTACSSSDFQGNEFKALVYEFMPNLSLESWLYPSPEAEDMTDEPKILGLLQRVDISIDVASALDYLHNHCHKPIVHCDLKPANILLDKYMTARVSDFGLAKCIPELVKKSHPSQSSSFGIRGTVGYAAPEYGTGGKVSSYGDVYSFGILLLEMFTGKRPTDRMFNDGMTLHNFAKTALPGRIDEILDPMIRPRPSGQEEEEITAPGNETIGQTKVDQMKECMISIVRIGIACSVESPRDRMDICDVVKEMQLIRDILRASETNYSSTSGSMRFECSSSRSATSNWQNVL